MGCKGGKVLILVDQLQGFPLNSADWRYVGFLLEEGYNLLWKDTAYVAISATTGLVLLFPPGSKSTQKSSSDINAAANFTSYPGALTGRSRPLAYSPSVVFSAIARTCGRH